MIITTYLILLGFFQTESSCHSLGVEFLKLRSGLYLLKTQILNLLKLARNSKTVLFDYCCLSKGIVYHVKQLLYNVTCKLGTFVLSVYLSATNSMYSILSYRYPLSQNHC